MCYIAYYFLYLKRFIKKFYRKRKTIPLILYFIILYMYRVYCTPIKKKIKFFPYIRKFRVEQMQSHIWGRAS